MFKLPEGFVWRLAQTKLKTNHGDADAVVRIRPVFYELDSSGNIMPKTRTLIFPKTKVLPTKSSFSPPTIHKGWGYNTETGKFYKVDSRGIEVENSDTYVKPKSAYRSPDGSVKP